MPKFDIEVTRTASATAHFIVEADSLEEAKNKALDEAGDHEFGSGEADYETTWHKKL